MKETGLSRSSVHSYLPYTKVIYNAEELSLYAQRCRTYRKRKQAVKKLQSCMEDCIRKIDRHKRKARIAVEMFGRNIDMEIGLEIIAKITQGQSDPIENDINNLRIE